MDIAVIFLAIFPILFIGTWCTICLIISRTSGWHAVATAYPGINHKFEGKTFHMQSAKFGWGNYSNCLTIKVSRDGIYITVWPIFRLGHPPIFLPWTSIESPQKKKILWMRFVSFHVSTPKAVSIALSEKVFAEQDAAANP